MMIGIMTIAELEHLPLFSGLSKKDIKRFSALASTVEADEGDYLFHQGEPASRMFIMLDGKVSIRYNPGDGGELTVTTLERGGVFGWSAVLGRNDYTSGAVCTEPTRVISVQGNAFRSMCERHPSTGVVIVERLAEVIAGRLSSTREAVSQVLHETVANNHGNDHGIKAKGASGE
jgi:CRP-like cAMP-binding protein